MATNDRENGNQESGESQTSRLKPLLWQILGAAGMLAFSMAVFWFCFRPSQHYDPARWPLFNWGVLGFLVFVSLWAGAGLARLVTGYVRYRANRKAEKDPEHRQRHQQRRTTWFEWQMADASWIGIVLLALITNGLGLAVGIYALVVCQQPQARKKAKMLTVLSGCLTFVALIEAIGKLVP